MTTTETKPQFFSENVHGEKFYLDESQDGWYGSPALVNENGELYPVEVQTALIDIMQEELQNSILDAMNNNISPEDWHSKYWPEVEKIIKNRWFNLDYVGEQQEAAA